MNCGYSKELLALYVEGDLPAADAENRVAAHVSACSACRQYCEQLRHSQSFIKSRFRWNSQDPLTQDRLTEMRRSVMSQVDAVQQSLGWTVRLERLLVPTFRRHCYAAAGLAVIAVLSASLLGLPGQIGNPKNTGAGMNGTAAVFVAQNTLSRPADYREWVFAGSSLGLTYRQPQSSPMYHNVYIDPGAYREYARSGKFPEGTVMVLEMFSAETKQEPGLQGSYEKDLMALEVSVKDSRRFDGGWGFFNFTEGMGKLKSEAEALPQTAGCLSCHREKAATDHVFTQFYPVLRGIGS
jgi:hypothetical protein